MHELQEPGALALGQSLSFGSLAAAYFEYAKPRLKTCGRMQWTYRRYLNKLEEVPADSITAADVEQLRRALAEIVSAKTANSGVELISTIYNRASESGLIEGDNPARGLRDLPVDRRNRLLEIHELP